jgi:hypothetical protein
LPLVAREFSNSSKGISGMQPGSARLSTPGDMPLEAVMSVANRYKVLTLSGAQCFTMLRAMATRETLLAAQIKLAEANGEGQELINYLQAQFDHIEAARATFNNTPFCEGAKS